MATLAELGRILRQQNPGQYDNLDDQSLGAYAKRTFPDAYKDYQDEGSSVWREMLHHPIDTAKGATLDVLGGLAKQIFVESPKAIGRALDPTSGASATDRLADLGSGLTLGLNDALAKRWADNLYGGTRQPQDLNDYIVGLLKGSAEFALKDILPGQEALNLLQGRNQQGQSLSAEEAGQNITQGLLKLAPWAKDIGKASGLVVPEGKLPVNKTTTASQLAAAAEGQGLEQALKDAGRADRGIASTSVPPTGGASTEGPVAVTQGQKPLPDHAESLRDSMTPEQRQAASVSPMLEPPVAKAIQDQVVQTDFFRQVQRKNAQLPITEQERFTKNIGDAIRLGAIPSTSAEALATSYGIPVTEVNSRIADMLEHSMTKGAQMINTASQVKETALAALTVKFLQEPDPVVRQQLFKDIQAMKGQFEGSAPLTGWQKVVGWLNRMEDWRRRLIVGQMAVPIRDATSHAGVGLVQAFEDAVSGTVETISDLKKGQLNLGKSYGDLLGDWSAFTSRLGARDMLYRLTDGKVGNPAISELDNVTKQLPKIWDSLNNSFTYDTAGYTWRDIANKNLPQNGAQVIDALTSMTSTMQHLQQTFLAKAHFQARLEGNFRSLGFKPEFGEAGEHVSILKQIENGLKDDSFLGEDGKMQPNYQWALADSIDHALKQTFTWTPDSGWAKGIMNLYSNKDIPRILPDIITPFPRFLVNHMRWQLERSPGHWLDLFEPEFRDKLFNNLNDGIQTKEAARTLGQATSGLLLLNAAWVARNSGIAGPRYWEYKIGQNEKGEDEFLDSRTYQPFAMYSFLADVIKSHQTGKPLNLSSEEVVDAVAGLRNLSTSPVFGLADILRSLDSPNEETIRETLSRFPGQYFAGFFTPMKTINDARAAFGNEDIDITRYTKGQELVGPTFSILHPGILPPRYDPFTGEPERIEHPLLHQMAFRTKAMGNLEQTLARNPDFTIDNIVGAHGGPTANNMVAQAMGEIFQQQTGQGSFGDRLAAQVDKVPPELQTQVLREIMNTVRSSAADIAKGRDIRPFLTTYIKDLPPAMQQRVLAEFANHGIAPMK